MKNIAFNNRFPTVSGIEEELSFSPLIEIQTVTGRKTHANACMHARAHTLLKDPEIAVVLAPVGFHSQGNPLITLNFILFFSYSDVFSVPQTGFFATLICAFTNC